MSKKNTEKKTEIKPVRKRINPVKLKEHKVPNTQRTPKHGTGPRTPKGND
jgi:hypothetical protein